MTIQVKVIPNSRKTEIASKMADGTLKIRVAAPADKGKANEALCNFLAKHFGVPRDGVTILSGQTASRKLLRVDGRRPCAEIASRSILRRLGID